MAERGFLAIAFDPSYTGESSGEPRYVASPDIHTENFSAAVDFLSMREDVDSERIGIIGICGWGGMTLNAAAIDTRIKATVTVTMYDMSRVNANGYFDAMDADARYELRKKLNAQRTIDARNGSYALAGGVVDPLPRVNANGYFDAMDADARYELRKKLNAQRTIDARNGSYALAGGVVDPLPEDAPQFVKDYYDYYKTKRGYHKRSLNSNNGWNVTSSLSFINTPLLTYSDEIRSAVLMIHGEKAHSRYFSEDAFKKLKGDNKELLIIPGASHLTYSDEIRSAVLMIHGEKAHSRYFSEDAFKKLKGDNKELLIIPGASHVDLYDNQAGVIPFDKIERFFYTYLK